MPKRPVLRSIASVLVAAFLIQDLAYANPDPDVTGIFPESALRIQFPPSVAVVEDVFLSEHRTPNSELIYLLQDAHANDSAQRNIARAIGTILEREPVRHVFLEAGTGDDSLSFLRNYGTAAKKESVARKFLRRGLIQGPDYLDITSSRPFLLWGVEDKTLYRESLDRYRRLREKRGHLNACLDRLRRALETLKPRFYRYGLLRMDALREDFLRNKIPLAAYLEALTAEARRLGIAARFPHLGRLEALRQKESKIDFGEFAFTSARSADLSLRYASEDSFSLRHSAYLDYLELAKTIDAGKILEEKEALEDALAAALAESADERALLEVSRSLEVLRRLVNLELGGRDEEAIRGNPSAFDPVELAGLLNRKILELGSHHEEAIFLDPQYEAGFADAIEFYALARRRDEAFLRNMLSKMEESGQKKAVLVAGGHHTEHLKALFRQRNISYLSITPRILHETNPVRYENLLLGQSGPIRPSAEARSPRRSMIGLLPGREGITPSGRALTLLLRDFGMRPGERRKGSGVRRAENNHLWAENRRPKFMIKPEETMVVYKRPGESLSKEQKSSLWGRLPSSFKESYVLAGLPDEQEGLVILTLNSELDRLAKDNPGTSIPLIYELSYDHNLGEKDVRRIQSGIEVGQIRDGSGEPFIFRPTNVKFAADNDSRHILVTVKYGDEERLPEMLRDLGYPPTRTRRVSFGAVSLAEIQTGDFRRASWEDLISLIGDFGVDLEVIDSMVAEHRKVLEEETEDRRVVEDLLRDTVFLKDVFEEIFARPDLTPDVVKSRDIVHLGEGSFRRVYQVHLRVSQEPQDFTFVVKVVKPEIQKTDSGYDYNKTYGDKIVEIARQIRERFLHLYPPVTSYYVRQDRLGRNRLVSAEGFVPPTRAVLDRATRDRFIIKTYLMLYLASAGGVFIEDPKRPNAVVRRKGRSSYFGTIVDLDNLVYSSVSLASIVFNFILYTFREIDVFAEIIDTLGSGEGMKILNEADFMSDFTVTNSKDFRNKLAQFRPSSGISEKLPMKVPETIEVHLNGVLRKVPSDVTMWDILFDRAGDFRYLVVELNGEVVSAAEKVSYQDIHLKNGDQIRFYPLRSVSPKISAEDVSGKSQNFPVVVSPQRRQALDKLNDLRKDLLSLASSVESLVGEENRRLRAFRQSVQRQVREIEERLRAKNREAATEPLDPRGYQAVQRMLDRVDFVNSDSRVLMRGKLAKVVARVPEVNKALQGSRHALGAGIHGAREALRVQAIYESGARAAAVGGRLAGGRAFFGGTAVERAIEVLRGHNYNKARQAEKTLAAWGRRIVGAALKALQDPQNPFPWRAAGVLAKVASNDPRVVAALGRALERPGLDARRSVLNKQAVLQALLKTNPANLGPIVPNLLRVLADFNVDRQNLEMVQGLLASAGASARPSLLRALSDPEFPARFHPRVDRVLRLMDEGAGPRPVIGGGGRKAEGAGDADADPMSYFGRDGHMLNESVAHVLLKSEDGASLRILTVGSAAGHEGYDVAMALAEELGRTGKNIRAQIVVSDIDPRLVMKARQGDYSLRSARWPLYLANQGDDLTPDESRDRFYRFFKPSGEAEARTYSPDKKDLARRGIEMQFRQLDILNVDQVADLAKDGRFHFIVARNVHYRSGAAAGDKNETDRLYFKNLSALLEKRGLAAVTYGLLRTDIDADLRESLLGILSKEELDRYNKPWNFSGYPVDLISLQTFMLSAKIARGLRPVAEKLADAQTRDSTIRFLADYFSWAIYDDSLGLRLFPAAALLLGNQAVSARVREALRRLMESSPKVIYGSTVTWERLSSVALKWHESIEAGTQPAAASLNIQPIPPFPANVARTAETTGGGRKANEGKRPKGKGEKAIESLSRGARLAHRGKGLKGKGERTSENKGVENATRLRRSKSLADSHEVLQGSLSDHFEVPDRRALRVNQPASQSLGIHSGKHSRRQRQEPPERIYSIPLRVPRLRMGIDYFDQVISRAELSYQKPGGSTSPFLRRNHRYAQWAYSLNPLEKAASPLLSPFPFSLSPPIVDTRRIKNFLVSVAWAAEPADGSRLALKERGQTDPATVYRYRKTEGTQASFEGPALCVDIDLSPSARIAGRSKSAVSVGEASPSFQEIRTDTAALERRVAEGIAEARLPLKPVVLTVDVDLFPGFNLEEFLIPGVERLRRLPFGQNVYFRAVGDPERVRKAEATGLFSPSLPPEVEESASRVALAPAEGGAGFDGITLFMETMEEGCIFPDAVLHLSVAAGRIDPDNIPDWFVSLCSDMVKEKLDAAILKAHLLGKAPKHLVFKAVTRIPWQKALQFYQNQRRLQAQTDQNA
ncbi:MAG: hypothetical protein HYT89_01280 [Candidatus Omnitrophica bacterium]|nr:hypothetical protein [Candidatus Omnitrophota bacterium]